jgi:hypothetical protein
MVGNPQASKASLPPTLPGYIALPTPRFAKTCRL